MKPYTNIVGWKFGRLTVLRRVVKNSRTHWVCECDCGNITKPIKPGTLLAGMTKSCGCLNQEIRRETCKKNFLRHGKTRTTEWICWTHIRSRCENPKDKAFHNYGGRGIKICARWQKFENFLKDMGPRPSSKHSIDRIDNNKNYSPSNCRWATHQEQMNNVRYNRMITFNGKTQTLAQWSRETGIKSGTIRARLFGANKPWSIEKALTTIPK